MLSYVQGAIDALYIIEMLLMSEVVQFIIAFIRSLFSIEGLTALIEALQIGDY